MRVVSLDGEPWFVLSDLASVMEIREVSRLASRISDDLRQTHPIPDRLGRLQPTTIVNEAGMYEVVLRSDKPEAAIFRRWITSEVLPQIRKTGGYGTPPALSDDEIVAQALQITSAKVKQLEAKVEADAPKVEYHDTFVAVDDDVVILRVAAQQLGVSESFLREQLVAWRWIYRMRIGERWSNSKQQLETVYEWRPYADHAHLFQLRPQHNAPRHHNGQVRQTLYVKSTALPRIGHRLEVA